MARVTCSNTEKCTGDREGCRHHGEHDCESECGRMGCNAIGMEDATCQAVTIEHPDTKAYAVFVLNTAKWLHIAGSRDLGPKLEKWLGLHPIFIGGDTHLARFFRGDGPASGKLESSMPGSTFEHFQFERHTFGGGDDAITAVVGWYW